MVPVTEPVTVIRLDTPAGLVEARVAVRAGRAESVTIRNVPSYVVRLDSVLTVERYGQIRCDIAFGGNFYAIADLAQLGIPFEPAAKQRMLDVGLAIIDAVNKAELPVHPVDPAIRGCHHVYLAAPGSDARHSRHAMVIYPGWFDRSPCGTGTSARMAAFHARGALGLNQDFRNESLIGRHFTGRLIAETTVDGIPAIVPTITGSAWITGISQYLLDPADPFPEGFSL
jgi:proline racemase